VVHKILVIQKYSVIRGTLFSISFTGLPKFRSSVHSHHELIMIANNLGSIPPNTSLMVTTTKSKRYEVFISSSEQKNAKVIIDLKQ
jgi:hypothetical protein